MNPHEVRDADVWWARLPGERKVQIRRWIDPDARGHADVPGQLSFDNIHDQPTRR